MDYSKILNNGKKNIIWGASCIGVDILAEAICRGIYINCFCDSDIKKQEICLWNKRVLSPDCILKESEEWNVIIGTSNPETEKAIIDTLHTMGVNNYFRGIDFLSERSDFYAEHRTITKLVHEAKKKKIILYGFSCIAEQIINTANMLDISIAYIVDDHTDANMCGIAVKDIYALAYENPAEISVIISDYSNLQLSRKKLDEIGLIEKKNYDVWKYYSYGNFKTYILDPNLGHSFKDVSSPDASGIVILGSINAKIKIALLGGSTTDATRFTWKSWGEYLYEILKENQNDICIINAACSGYNSSQELVKLIRDVVPLNPDIVISYSGFNDSQHYYGREELELYPFVGHYQYDMAKLVAKHISYERMEKGDDSYALGLAGKETRYERYERNVHIMKVICESYGIRFYAVLQPILANIKQYTSDELELIISNKLEDRIKRESKFYEDASNRAKNDVEWVDMTEIFEGIEGVYIDDCHTTEKGNSIVAVYIYDMIKGDF